MSSLGVVTRENLIELIGAQAAIMQQNLDEASLGKLSELNDAQIVKLYEEFQDRVIHSAERPIRNVSALLVSLTRGLLSGRINTAPGHHGGPSAMSNTASSVVQALLGGGGQMGGNRAPLMSPKSFMGSKGGITSLQTTSGGGDPGSVRLLLEQSGITGVDEAACQKLEELAPEDCVALLTEFQQANSTEHIMSPSKWLFARARSHLVQQRKQGIATTTPRVMITGGQEIPELPGVLLDNECIEKMAELEPEERLSVIAEFQQESATSEIRNPSSWLFSKSRARIVIRVTGGRPMPRSLTAHLPPPAQTSIFAIGDPYKELAEIGVDDLAISKLKELSPADLQTLLVQFMQLYTQAQINDPSKWLYAKARSIAAKLSQQQRQQYQHESTYNSSEHTNEGEGGGNVPELAGVTLDEKALAKLEELEPEERSALFIEYAIEASRKSIQNPSGWVFGRARTKVVDRLTGKGRTERRSAPY